MMIALARVDCCDFFSLMTTFSGKGTEFQSDPFNYLDGVPSIHPPLDITDTDSDSEAPVEGDTIPVTPDAPSTSAASTAMTMPPVVPKELKDKSKSKVTYVNKVPDIADAPAYCVVGKRGDNFWATY